MRGNFFTYYSVIILYLFTYSGLIKWATFGIDPALLLLVLSFTLLPLFSIIKLNRKIIYILFVFFLFHVALFSTSIYSISTHYYLEKLFKISLNIYIFFLALAVFNHLKAFEYLIKINRVILFLAISLLLLLYTYDGLSIIRYREESEASLVPEYMSVSYYLAVSILMLIPLKNSIFKLLLIVSALFLMIILAAKGPILFLLIAYIYISISGKKLLTTGFLKKAFFSLLIFTLSLSAIWNTSFLDNFKSRIFFLNGPELDESSLQRVLYIEKSFEIIRDNPILGVGIGGFGKAFTGIDERLSSHNLILEIYTESGLLGLTLLLLLIYFIRLLIVDAKKNTLNSIYSDYIKVYAAIIILMFLSSLVASYLEDSRIPYFWIAVGVSYLSITSKENFQKK